MTRLAAPTRPGSSRRLTRRAALAELAAGALALAACAPGAAPAAPTRVARIGYLSKAGSHTAPYFDAFRQGLRELGYVEGQNLTIEYRIADVPDDRLKDVARELVDGKVDLIVARCSPEARAASAATATIPIVMIALTGDPVGTKLVRSVARPGGNVTGLTILAPELSGKRVELLKEAFPEVSRAAVLWNAAIPESAADLREMERTARASNVAFQVQEVRGGDDFARAFAAVGDSGSQSLLTALGTLGTTHRARIVAFEEASRLPGMYELREYVDAGGLMSYGPNLPDLYRRAATYVAKILNGAKPEDLPVERPTRFELVVNLKTARARGVTIPTSVLAQAADAIE